MQKRVSNVRPPRKPPSRKASSDDVLSDRKQREKVPAKWAVYYRRLLDLRDHLARERQELKRSASEDSPHFSQHMADAGTDSFDRDFALGVLSNEQDALYQIEQALDRIRNGTYGICEVTGKLISKERLAAIPWTRFSMAAEKQLEQQGHPERTQARIGEVEIVPRTSTDHQVGEEQETS